MQKPPEISRRPAVIVRSGSLNKNGRGDQDLGSERHDGQRCLFDECHFNFLGLCFGAWLRGLVRSGCGYSQSQR